MKYGKGLHIVYHLICNVWQIGFLKRFFDSYCHFYAFDPNFSKFGGARGEKHSTDDTEYAQRAIVIWILMFRSC